MFLLVTLPQILKIFQDIKNGFLAEDSLYKSETIYSEHTQALLNRFQTMYIDDPSYFIDGPYLDKFTNPNDPDPESETESEEDHGSDDDYINSSESESDNDDDISEDDSEDDDDNDHSNKPPKRRKL